MKTYSFKSLLLSAFYAGTTLALIGSVLSESADASRPPLIMENFSKMLENKFEKVDSLYGDVNPTADFYVFILADAVTNKYKFKYYLDAPISKALFSGPLKPVNSMRATKKVEVILCHAHLNINETYDQRKEYVTNAYKKLRVRVPFYVPSLESNVSCETLENTVFILSKDNKLLHQGEDELLAYWRDYTLRPVDKEKCEAKMLRFRKKRDEAIEKRYQKYVNTNYVTNRRWAL